MVTRKFQHYTKYDDNDIFMHLNMFYYNITYYTCMAIFIQNNDYPSVSIIIVIIILNPSYCIVHHAYMIILKLLLLSRTPVLCVYCNAMSVLHKKFQME